MVISNTRAVEVSIRIAGIKLRRGGSFGCGRRGGLRESMERQQRKHGGERQQQPAELAAVSLRDGGHRRYGKTWHCR